ncbi:serine hydrolase domain-containing protein [Streptomyces sp. H34-S4]|uniref:serine hydrolase domain-containing protein n=1 Tax=Streptomyces sp. H34-S4 TaxID=2996463 RepID=UPI00227197FE|nr:serine hydrolase domain-containing protein [Streptomyces sp. H34-S4]MCY0934129.1 serine hydrolase [Streptomyces sp. H34-S4]
MAKLDADITKVMKETGIPGLNIGVWIPGRGAYERSFGTADTKNGTPMKADLHTRIGSISKTFTVTGVLQLVDEGKVGLDDPISRYVTGVPNGEHITVRHSPNCAAVSSTTSTTSSGSRTCAPTPSVPTPRANSSTSPSATRRPSIAAQYPTDKAVLVVLVNSDVNYNRKNFASIVARTVTLVVTPDHPWPIPTPAAPE